MKNTIEHNKKIVQNTEIPDGRGQPPHNPEEHCIGQNTVKPCPDQLDKLDKFFKSYKHNCA